MSKLRITKELKEAIELNYDVFGYQKPEEFIDLLEKEDKQAFQNAAKLVTNVKVSNNAIKSVLKRGYELGDPKAGFTLALFYDNGCVIGENDKIKAINLYKDIIKKYNLELAKFRLAKIYVFENDFKDKKDIGFKYFDELIQENNEYALKISEVAEQYEEYELAIKYLRLLRNHVVINGHDYYDDLDAEGVMLYNYAKISDLYLMLGDKEKSEFYLEEAIKANIDNAYIVKGWRYQLNGEFDKAKELFESRLETSRAEATCALGDLYLDNKYENHDIKKAHEYFKESSLLGHEYAKEQLAKIEYFFDLDK